MGGYLHRTGIKLQLASGVGLAISFVIVSDFWWRTPLKYFVRSGWGGGSHVGTDQKNLVFLFSLITPVAG
jgi:hypothetical protein